MPISTVINYLSGAGLAASIGLAHTTTMQNRLSVDLKAILGEGFTTVQGQYNEEYAIAQQQVASLFGLTTNHVTRDIKAILAEDSGLTRAKTNRNTGDAKNATEVALSLVQ